MPTSYFIPQTENDTLSWNWVTLRGPDCQDFLHRLTTVHVKNLQPGEGAPGCFLTAQGKIRSYFYLWNRKAEQYFFEVDGGQAGKWKTALLQVIDQYTFGERMTLEDSSIGLKCIWVFPDSNFSRKMDFPQAGHLHETSENIVICNHGETTYGRTWLTVWAKPEILDPWVREHLLGSDAVKEVEFSEIEMWRIQSLQPRVGSEITDTSVPLEVGLKHVIAENKGCYPGQEVVEKIIALGSPAKRLVKIEGQGIPPQPGERLHAAPGGPEIGTVTSVQSSQKDQFSALALVRKTHAIEGAPIHFNHHPEIRGTVVKIAPYA
jgi:folate-binding protein YgfZ